MHGARIIADNCAADTSPHRGGIGERRRKVMPGSRLLQGWLAAGLVLAGAGLAGAQTFPTKPLRIVTSAPGGTSDFTSRLIARALTEALGKQVIVDNRGNFGGDILRSRRLKQP